MKLEAKSSNPVLQNDDLVPHARVLHVMQLGIKA
jgi:hypothetical protein